MTDAVTAAISAWERVTAAAPPFARRALSLYARACATGDGDCYPELRRCVARYLYGVGSDDAALIAGLLGV